MTGGERSLGPASGWLELSTDPGRELGHLDPRKIVLGPDEGVLVRIR